jgi:hypothetical protein
MVPAAVRRALAAASILAVAAAGAAAASATRVTAPGPAGRVYPFTPSEVLLHPRRSAVPAFWADGRACSAGCRPAGAIPGWPLKPFHAQHAIRAGLNERRDTTFHVGIDIQALDHQAVYAIQPGRAHIVQPTGDDSRVQVGNYIYWHIRPAVAEGQWVVPFRTLVGRITKRFRHVHLSEVRGTGDVGPGNQDGRYLNPLRPGGRVLFPWSDTSPPVIGRPQLRAGGRVLVEVFDPQSFRVRTDYETPVLAPAALAFRIDGGPYRWELRGSQHMRWTAAVSSAVWAPGTVKAGYGCFATRVICRPRWRYVLAGGLAPPIPARTLAPGRHRLRVFAWDWAGNVTERRLAFAVTRDHRLGRLVDGKLVGRLLPGAGSGYSKQLAAQAQRPSPPHAGDRG